MVSLTKTRIIIAAVFGIAGLGGAVYATGIVQTPDYGLEDRGDWGEVSNNSVEIVSSGWVNNPNSFKLNISSLDIGYSVKMNNVKLAEGGKEGLYIPAEDNTTLDVSTELIPERAPKWWVSHIRNDEKSRLNVPVNLQLDVFGYPVVIDGVSYTDSIETDIESMMDSAVSSIEGTYSYETVPETVVAPGAETDIEVRKGSAKFGKVSSESTNLLVDLTLHNPNDYTIPTPQFNGNLRMNGIELASWQANEVNGFNTGNAKLNAGETREVRFKLGIDNSKMDEWFVTHASNSERTDGQMKIRLGFDLFGTTASLPPNGIKCDFRLQTAILEDNQKSENNFEGCQEGVIGAKNNSDNTEDSSGSSDSFLENEDSGSDNDSSDGGLLDSSGLY